MEKIRQFITVLLLIILSVSAFYGGYLLMTQPNGEALMLPISLLDHTPFSSYLIPGIFLFTLLGMCSLLTILLIFIQHPLAGKFVLVQSVVLVSWLVIQLLFNPYFFYFQGQLPAHALAVLLFVLGWWSDEKQRERKRTSTD